MYHRLASYQVPTTPSGACCACVTIEARSNDIFHLHFSVVWMGSRSTVVLCTALSLTSAFHGIRDHNRTKEVYTEGSLWNNKYESGRQLVRSRRKFQDNETCAADRFELRACTTFTSIERHHVGATPPDGIAHAY